MVRLVAWTIWIWASSIACAAEPIQVAYLWQSQPTLAFEWRGKPQVANVRVTPDQVTSQFVSERMFAAQTILRVPYSKTLDRATLMAALLERLKSGEPDSVVRTQLIAAACEWDDGSHAAQFWDYAKSDRLAQRVVEQACIQWRLPVPLQQWRERVKSSAAMEADYLRAIEGLAATGSIEDVEVVKRIVLDGTYSNSVRMAAARAVGALSKANELALAQQLRGSSSPDAELLAVQVLANSPPADVTSYVQEIAIKSKPIAQRAAYSWLCDRDPAAAQRLVDTFLRHSDPTVRALAMQQVTLATTDATVPALLAGFSDEHPANREKARELLLGYSGISEANLKATQDQLREVFASEQWRPLEQCIRLAVELGQKEHVDRCLTLLNHERAEVTITAGWALRNLVTEEAALKSMLEHVTKLTDQLMTADQQPAPSERYLRSAAHIFECFGQQNYQAALPLLKKYVPKNPSMGIMTRMTAIWSCGKLCENGEDLPLMTALHQRIADKNNMSPESESVRFASTLALGWIAHPDSRQPLIKCDESKPGPIGCATEWALQRIDQREKN